MRMLPGRLSWFMLGAPEPAMRLTLEAFTAKRAVRYPYDEHLIRNLCWWEPWPGWAGPASARPASSGCTPAKRRAELGRRRSPMSDVKQVIGRTRPRSECSVPVTKLPAHPCAVVTVLTLRVVGLRTLAAIWPQS